MVRVFRMSSRGLASRITKSAVFPGAIVPTSLRPALDFEFIIARPLDRFAPRERKLLELGMEVGQLQSLFAVRSADPKIARPLRLSLQHGRIRVRPSLAEGPLVLLLRVGFSAWPS